MLSRLVSPSYSMLSTVRILFGMLFNVLYAMRNPWSWPLCLPWSSSICSLSVAIYSSKMTFSWKYITNPLESNRATRLAPSVSEPAHACFRYRVHRRSSSPVNEQWSVFNVNSLSLQLLDMIFRDATLLQVTKSVTRNGRSIMLTMMLALILIYLFSLLGFLFFRDDFVSHIQSRLYSSYPAHRHRRTGNHSKTTTRTSHRRCP